MAEYDLKNRKNKQEEDDATGGDEGTRGFEWQTRMYEVYELIHDSHIGEKAPVEGFNKDKINEFEDDPVLNQDLHPLAQEAYFSGIDNTIDNAVPSENHDPNVRAELKKQLEYKLQLGNKPSMVNTPKPI